MPLRKATEQFEKRLLIVETFTTGMWEDYRWKFTAHARIINIANDLNFDIQRKTWPWSISRSN